MTFGIALLLVITTWMAMAVDAYRTQRGITRSAHRQNVSVDREITASFWLWYLAGAFIVIGPWVAAPRAAYLARKKGSPWGKHWRKLCILYVLSCVLIPVGFVLAFFGL